MYPETAAGIVVRGLNFSYGSREVFKNFALESDHNIIVLTGPSGCGKTTLLKLLSGNILPDTIETAPSSEDACLILQEDGLLPWLSGLSNLTLIGGLTEEEIKSHPLFQAVEHFLHSPVHYMSFGQRRMLELFRAICRKPSFLLLDEPSNFLDIEKRQLLFKALKETYFGCGRLVVSTHHKDEVEAIDGEAFLFDGTFPVRALTKG
jgi:NitT/TauT family transport system ATP-binding protein